MKKNHGLVFIIFLGAAATLAAQSNDFIDKLLEKQEASYGDAVFLALASAGLVKPDGTVAEAIAFIQAAQWGFMKQAEEPATLGDLCYVLMRAYNIPGGAMYALFPGPRYAAREFEYLGWVRRAPVPTRHVKGEEVMQIVGQVLKAKEAAQ